MRFTITEEEKVKMRKLHLEQSSLDGNRYNTIYSDAKKTEKFNREQRELVSMLSVDDTIDVISGLIDGIPGIGNLISAGIDVTHALAYAVRFLMDDDTDKKVEYGALAFLTFATSSMPMVGNSINIVSRVGIKGIIRSTPQEILLLAKKLGVYEKTFLLLSKGKWKYNFYLALCRIAGGELIEVVPKVINEVRTLKNRITVKQIRKALNEFEMLLMDFKEYYDVVNPVASKLA